MTVAAAIFTGIAFAAGGAAGTNCVISAGYFGRPCSVVRACGHFTVFAFGCPRIAIAAGGTAGTNCVISAGYSVGPISFNACENVTDAVHVFALDCPVLAFTAGVIVGTRSVISAGLFVGPFPVIACGVVTDIVLVIVAGLFSGHAFAAADAVEARDHPSAGLFVGPFPVNACGVVTDAVLAFALGCPVLAFAAGDIVGTRTHRAGFFDGEFPVNAYGNIIVFADLAFVLAFAASDPFFVARDIGAYLFDGLAVEAFGDDADALVVVPAGGGAIYVASLGTGRLFLDTGTALGFRRFFLDA